jgi:hypothetical protein
MAVNLGKFMLRTKDIPPRTQQMPKQATPETTEQISLPHPFIQGIFI